MSWSISISVKFLTLVLIGYTAAKPGGARDQPQPTVTLTTTMISTTTYFDVCAFPLAVKSVCLQKRGFLDSEDPVVMMLDEGLEDVEKYFDPTTPYSAEFTPRIMLPDQLRFNLNDLESPDVVQSSKSDLYSRNEADSSLSTTYFNQIADIYSAMGRAVSSGINNLISNKDETITSIVTVSTLTSTTCTKTFFISVCTPSPFPFHVCSKRKMNL